MSGVTITVDDAGLRRTLDALTRATSDMRRPLDAIGMALVGRIKGTFVNQRDPAGNAWRALAPSTVAGRRKAGKGAQILRDTGRLMNSITHLASASEVVIGTDVEYAAAQQWGHPRWKDQSGRAFFPDEQLPFDWQEEIADILWPYFQGAIGGAA